MPIMTSCLCMHSCSFILVIHAWDHYRQTFLPQFIAVIILNWNVRGVGQVGFTHKIMELSSLFHQDTIFVMKAKVNSNKTDNIIIRLSRIFPIHFKVSSTGFTGGLWVL